MTATLLDPALESGPPEARRRLVVIGNGMAGARAVEEILARQGGEQFAITMIGEEPHGNYNRILLSDVLNGEQQVEEIFLNPLDWYEENGITLLSGARAVGIDRWDKVVRLEDGSSVGYDTLLIATGSRPFLPPMDGLDLPDGSRKPGVFVFRSIADVDALRSYAAHCDRVAVIGGGLLGLEAAYGLQQHDLEVTVVHRSGYLMNAQLDAQGGAVLRRSVEKLGLSVKLKKSTKTIMGEDHVTGLCFEDGSTLDCDMVVIATGITPNAEIAAEAGLEVERAIVVDDQMRCVDADDVYAVGECVQHRGEVYGLVAPLWEQAVVLADVLTGADPRAAYHGSKVATKLKVAGVALATMGLRGPEHEDDEFIQFVEPKGGVYKTAVVRGGKVLGAILLGDTNKVGFLQHAYDKATPVPADRQELFFDLATPDDEGAVADMPDDAQVCNCNGVDKCTIAQAAAGGDASPKQVMKKTKAGTACGSCKPLVEQIVEWAAGGNVAEDPSANWYAPGVPLDKPALIAAIREQELKSVSAVFDALADGKVDAASKQPLASLLKTLWNAEYVDERDGRFINDRVHGNIQKDGTFSVVPRTAGGVTSADELRRIADVVDKYEIPMVKITGAQRLDLLGVRKEDLPGVWADLKMESGHAYGKAFRQVKSCVGTDFCRFGVGDSTALAIAIENRFKGLESPGKLKLAATGCPRNCAEAMIKDIGAVAIEGGRWQIYIGGAGGSAVRKGDLLTTVDTAEEVLTLTGRFIQYYRENANWLERTYDFVPRVGIERLRDLLLEDSDGICEQLDAAMQATVDAFEDPWLERDDPKTEGQFRDALPIVDLPIVPVRSGADA